VLSTLWSSPLSASGRDGGARFTLIFGAGDATIVDRRVLSPWWPPDRRWATFSAKLKPRCAPGKTNWRRAEWGGRPRPRRTPWSGCAHREKEAGVGHRPGVRPTLMSHGVDHVIHADANRQS